MRTALSYFDCLDVNLCLIFYCRKLNDCFLQFVYLYINLPLLPLCRCKVHTIRIIIPLIMPCYRYLLDTAFIKITVIVVIAVTKTLPFKI